MPISRIQFEPSHDDNQVYDLSDYAIDFSITPNPQTGKPAGKPEIESFTITVTRDSEQDASYFMKWLKDPTTAQSADIVFYDQNRRVRAIKIQDAFLMDYQQRSINPGYIIEVFVLSPMEITLDGVVFKRKKKS